MKPPQIKDVRPLPGHYDPTGFRDAGPSLGQVAELTKVVISEMKIAASWVGLKSWPGREDFGPEGREHFGVLFIVMKVPGFGWSCWMIEWLHDGERTGTTVGTWVEDGHTDIWQTIKAKMRGTFTDPEFGIAGFFVAGIPGTSEFRTNAKWFDLQTGDEIEPVVDEPPVEPVDPPDLPDQRSSRHAEQLEILRVKFNLEIDGLVAQWKEE